VGRGIALVAHSIRRVRSLVVVMASVLAGFQLLLILGAGVIQESNAFGPLSNLLPDFMRQMLGPSVVSLLSFSGIVCLGYFHVVVVGALVGLVMALATEPAAEIETRFLDLVMAHPVPRHWVITRSITLIVACTLFVLTAMFLGTSIGLRWLGPKEAVPATLGMVRLLICNIGVLLLCWGGITLLFTSFARRRAVPASIAGLLALVSYLLDYLARVWKPARTVSWLSPFHYFNAVDLITTGALPLRDVRVLLGIAVCSFGLAYVCFAHRDL
jgi:ABC-2 type transport system permease protein